MTELLADASDAGPGGSCIYATDSAAWCVCPPQVDIIVRVPPGSRQCPFQAGAGSGPGSGVEMPDAMRCDFSGWPRTIQDPVVWDRRAEDGFYQKISQRALSFDSDTASLELDTE